MTIPKKLQNVIDEFSETPDTFLLPMLLEYSEKVPPLPEHLEDQRDQMERVPECQTPFFLVEEIDDEGRVGIYFDAPREAPTTRGFAGIVYEGLNGLPAEEILDVPDDFYTQLGLQNAISPLRMRSMSAIVWRLKRRVRQRVEAGQAAS